jgi:molybdopterin synthase sulfur carrier subunit
MSDHRPLRIEYFASFREAMGRSAEDIALPAAIGSAGRLVAWLRERDEVGRATFDDSVHIAIDDVMAHADSSLDGATSVALFPPMTGG